MTTEEELHQAWIDTRARVLQAIDAELAAKGTPSKTKNLLDLAETYAWLTRPDQAHRAGA